MHLTVFIHIGAGTRSKDDFLQQLSDQAKEKNWTLDVRSSHDANKKALAKRIAAQKNSTTIICGGDGTIHQVFKAFWQQKLLSKVPFLIYPGGTFNALVKNLNFSPASMSKLCHSIEQQNLLSADLLELSIHQGRKKRQDICHAGVAFVKDGRFAEHAAKIRKGLHQFNWQLGSTALKKLLKCLGGVDSFSYQQGKKQLSAQGILCANSPYFVTEKPVYPGMSIADRNWDLFSVDGTGLLQWAQMAHVLLLGSQRKLDFLQHSAKKKLTLTFQESVDMNLDGDLERLQKEAEVTLSLSRQKLRLIKYL